MERVREQQQQQHQQQQQQLRRVLRRSEVTARRDNARRADVDRSALQYAMASSLRQLLPEQRLECLELAQVMAASKREDEEQRAGVAVAEARDETQAIVTSNIYQHPLWSKLPDDLIDMVVDFTLRSGFSPSIHPEEDPYFTAVFEFQQRNLPHMHLLLTGRAATIPRLEKRVPSYEIPSFLPFVTCVPVRVELSL